MDPDLDGMQQESPQSSHNDQIIENHMPDACALCQRVIFFDDAVGDLEDLNVCGDCKVLLLEQLGTPVRDSHQRWRARVRTRYNSLESMEHLFSQQFTNIINLSRQRQHTGHVHDAQSVDTAAARSMQRTSSRITPIGSGRWRRVLSDTESDGVDSLYGESESNVSFSGYMYFNGESDTISLGLYGGESDASVDGRSSIDSEIFAHPGTGSHLDNDTDIDPMHAGISQWNSDDQDEEDEDEDDNEWEEADSGLNTAHSLGAAHWHTQYSSPDSQGPVRWRIEERRQTYIPDTFEEPEFHYYAGNPGDYLDARGFEELIENLADADGSRQGAPPAAISFVRNLRSLVINEEQEKKYGLACAICKDSLIIGTVVNELPCHHLYHPSCILPWLCARSTCPLCRYELPTDDNDYEDRKQSILGDSVEFSQNNINDNGSSVINDVTETDEPCELTHGTVEQGNTVAANNSLDRSGRQNSRRRWFFAAAGPVVSLVGIVLVMWLGHPLTERRELINRDNHVHRPNHNPFSGPTSQREIRNRRWWLF